MKTYPSFSPIETRESLQDGDIPLAYVSMNNIEPDITTEEMNTISSVGQVEETITPYAPVKDGELLFSTEGKVLHTYETEEDGEATYFKDGIIKEFTPLSFELQAYAKRTMSYKDASMIDLNVGVIETPRGIIAQQLVSITGNGASRNLIPDKLRINKEDTSYTAFYDFEEDQIDILIIESEDGIHYAQTNEVIDIDSYVSKGISVWVVTTKMEDGLIPSVIEDIRFENPPYPTFEVINDVDYQAEQIVPPTIGSIDVPESLNSEEYDIGYEIGYEYGFKRGFYAGHLAGYRENFYGGYSDGARIGRLDGESQGQRDGYDLGYDHGFVDQSNKKWNGNKALIDVEKSQPSVPAEDETNPKDDTVLPYFGILNNKQFPLEADDPRPSLSGERLEGAKAGYAQGAKDGTTEGRYAGENAVRSKAYNAGYDKYYVIGYIEAKREAFVGGYLFGKEVAISKESYTKDNVRIKSPNFYKQDRIALNELSSTWSTAYLLENLGGGYQPVFLFEPLEAVAILEKPNYGYAMYFSREVFQSILDYRMLVSEMFLFVGLNRYVKTRPIKHWVTDAPVSYLINTSQKLGDTQPALPILTVTEGAIIDTRVSIPEGIEYQGTLNDNVRFKKTAQTDPVNEGYASIYTKNDTVVFYEEKAKRIETKLDYTVTDTGNKISISIAPIKSSRYRLNTSRTLIDVKKSDGTYYVCAKDTTVYIRAKKELLKSDLPLVRVDIRSVTKPKLFDASIPGGGLPLKYQDDYNVLDVTSTQGRPYREASCLVITLPKDTKQYEARIQQALEKHKDAGQVIKIKYE